MKKFKDFLFKNTSDKQTVAKNTVWIFLGDLFGRLLRMGLIIYAARVLGTDGWGVFSYATSIGIILVIFSDIGISSIITREASQKKEGYKTFIGTAVLLKIILVVASTILLLFVGPLVSHIPETAGIFIFIAAISFFDNLRELCFYINRASEKMERETIIKTIMNVVILVAGIILLKMNATPIAMALAYTLGSAVGFFIIAIVIRRDLAEFLKKADRKMFGIVLKVAWPFAVITLITIILGSIDTYMLGFWKDAHEIGLYSSVQRIYAFVAVIPGTLTVATFPLMSRLANVDRDKFRATLEKAISILLLLGLPIALGGALLSRELVLLLFGPSYAGAIPIMAVMMLMILISFPLTLLSNAVFAYNKQKGLSSIYILGIVVNIGLNFWLIPPWGALGAAIATLVSTLIMTGAIWIKVRHINYFEILPVFKKLILPCLVAVLSILLFKYLGAPVVINIMATAILYFCALLFFKNPILRDLRETLKI